MVDIQCLKKVLCENYKSLIKALLGLRPYQGPGRPPQACFIPWIVIHSHIAQTCLVYNAKTRHSVCAQFVIIPRKAEAMIQYACACSKEMLGTLDVELCHITHHPSVHMNKYI